VYFPSISLCAADPLPATANYAQFIKPHTGNGLVTTLGPAEAAAWAEYLKGATCPKDEAGTPTVPTRLVNFNFLKAYLESMQAHPRSDWPFSIHPETLTVR